MALNPPLTSPYKHGDGVLVSGTVRIARADFDTNPSQKVQDDLLDWICETLNDRIREVELERQAKALLPRAIALAHEQHANQVDKAGRPYIEHPMRVMRTMTTYAECVVAVLHDVIEDGAITLQDLAKERFPKEIRDALDSVTRRNGETYDAFIERAGANPIGHRVKYEDLRDNARLDRIPNPTEADHARTAKYHRAIARLDAIRFGGPALEHAQE